MTVLVIFITSLSNGSFLWYKRGWFVKQILIQSGFRPIKAALMERGKNEPVEVKCPRCKYTEIIYIPKQDIPKCPECGTTMLIEELLDEGKSY